MKLANNFLSATAMVATSEAVVMGVKSGLDPAVMIDVINAGSGHEHREPRQVSALGAAAHLRFRFATGLMVKDVRLSLEEMKSLGLSMEVAEAVGRSETVIRDMGADSDFTARSSRSRRRRVSWWADSCRGQVAPARERSADARRCVQIDDRRAQPRPMNPPSSTWTLNVVTVAAASRDFSRSPLSKCDELPRDNGIVPARSVSSIS